MHLISHSWNLDYNEAVRLQEALAEKVSIRSVSKQIRFVAGGDISFNLQSKTAFSGFVVYDIINDTVVEQVSATSELKYPYIPGLLSFREIPPLLEAWRLLPSEPDVYMLDGHGIAHPRKLGLASHFGLWVDKPTIGCAKNLLAGTYREPGKNKGEASILWDEDESSKLGYVVRTRTDVKPVFVSPGHNINFEQAVDIALRCSPRYKIPEPIRRAHKLVNKKRKEYYQTKNLH